MNILTPSNWADYELLDSGNGKRLERFGTYTLIRPDPQIIWQTRLPKSEWDKADAIFERTYQDKGKWINKTTMPDKWLINYKDLSFFAKLTPFKHTGIFPEQSVQWDWIEHKIKSDSIGFKDQKSNAEDTNKKLKILNLFAYTGIASLVAAHAGAEVTHVDASRSTIAWAKENQEASKLSDKPIRWILDNAVQFTEREVRRKVKYDGIIMDPPVFGHGPSGELWKFNEHFPKLLQTCKQLLSNNPLFIVINAYAISSSALMLKNVLQDILSEGTIEVGELALQEKNSERLLSTGIFARWSRE